MEKSLLSIDALDYFSAPSLVEDAIFIAWHPHSAYIVEAFFRCLYIKNAPNI
jgi:hypothetical protein